MHFTFVPYSGGGLSISPGRWYNNTHQCGFVCPALPLLWMGSGSTDLTYSKEEELCQGKGRKDGV